MRTELSRSLNSDLHSLFTQPQFGAEAAYIADKIKAFGADDLSEGLAINAQLGEQTRERYAAYGSGENELLPAMYGYNGVVFKSIEPESFSFEQAEFAQSHLLITSFLYGLLRPFDTIEPYRLEGKFCFDTTSGETPFSWWRSRLTDALIDAVKASGGILCNLASSEMKRLFDYKRVCAEVEVVEPTFFTHKGGKNKTIVVHTKIARGLMTRYILENQISSTEKLGSFDAGGYRHIGDLQFLRME